jgi:pimeloyl-ACP methyl ester carboxylesterase
VDPVLRTAFRVIAIEQMGYGRTADVVDGPFHYHDMAEDTVELMRQLAIESAATVGYSDGGIIGDGDIVTPEHTVEMFRTIPAAQLCVVPRSGHDVMPKETILTFLQEGATGET